MLLSFGNSLLATGYIDCILWSHPLFPNCIQYYVGNWFSFHILQYPQSRQLSAIDWLHLEQLWQKGGEKGLFSTSMPYIYESDRKQKHGKLIILVRVCFEYLLEAIYVKIFSKDKQKMLLFYLVFLINDWKHVLNRTIIIKRSMNVDLEGLRIWPPF